MNLHPGAAVLAFLLGTWQGDGAGRYPTVPDFGYREELEFWHVGKPFLAYRQRTWALDDGRPLHTEAGYWRPTAGGLIELVVAHPSGHVEIEEGSVQGDEADGFAIETATTLVGATSTAKKVTALSRRITFRGGVLTNALEMAAVGQPLQAHLSAILRRTG